MKTTKIDRATIRKINAEMEEALQAVAKKYGVNVALGSTSFNASEMTTKVSFKIVDADGVSKADKAVVDLFVGPNTLGREFTLGGRSFRLDGFNRKGKRTPVLGTDVNSGKRYRFAVEDVRRALGIGLSRTPINVPVVGSTAALASDARANQAMMDAEARAEMAAEARVS